MYVGNLILAVILLIKGYDIISVRDIRISEIDVARGQVTSKI